MKVSSTITSTLDRALENVEAIETLGASLAAGLHAGVVVPDHVQTLLAAIARQIRAELDDLGALLRHVRD